MHSRVNTGLVAAMVCTALALGGCGGDGKTAAPTATPTQTAVPATSTPTATVTPTPTVNPIQPGTRLSLDDGILQGEGDGTTRRFLGIPYAAPPLGDLRWQPPQPVARWNGVWDATAFGGPCAQLGGVTTRASNNEDCLYLNVWTPDPAPAAPLPVMVWFHGGGNQSGSASDPVPFGLGGFFYDGQGLSDLGHVVVVTLNYRLGVMGFFAQADLAAENPQRPHSGNQGLQDQTAALEWVQRNILAFGGDPDNVTIFGESAGSFDVCFHLVAPASRGLFHRAISQSGGCTTAQKTAAAAQWEADTFAEAVGCGDAPDTLACLRSLPVQDLLIEAPIDGGTDEPDPPGGDLYRGGTPRWSFNPIVDGVVLPDQPRALFDAGEFARVPYMLGSNTDEGTLFHIDSRRVSTEEEYLQALDRVYGKRASAVAERYPAANFDSPNDALIRVTGDSLLVCTTYDSARRAAAGGADVFLYNFDRPIPIPVLEPLGLGATHGAEIAYVFGSYRNVPPEDLALSETMRGYWSRFARNGDPNGAGALPWPAFRLDSDRRMNFNLELSVLSNFRAAECDFWSGLYDFQFEPGPDPGTGPWEPVPAERVAGECGLDPALLAAADLELDRPWAVIRHGRLCHEFYPTGEDEVTHVFSATKTLGALVTGVAAYQTRDLVAAGRKSGPLSDLDRVDHWLDSFSFNPDAHVGHVLAMVAHNEDLSYGSKEHSYDVIGNVQINRLSDIINTAIAQDPERLGADLDEFTRKFVFGPLGMRGSTWSDGLADKIFAYSWYSPLRDMARLGLLILNGGVWNGERVLDQSWTYRMTHPAFEDANTGYGYLTWMNSNSNYNFGGTAFLPEKLQVPLDPCAPPAINATYPHGLSAASDCNYAPPHTCEQQFDVGVWYAAGLGGQYIIGHPGLDLLLIGKDLGTEAGPRILWDAARPALVALDPAFPANEARFCAAYSAGDYAPD